MTKEEIRKLMDTSNYSSYEEWEYYFNEIKPYCDEMLKELEEKEVDKK